jgi:outer membrane protein assembly factor BamB
MKQKIGFWGLGSLILLSGCQFLEKEKIPLKGERISISTLNNLSFHQKKGGPLPALSEPINFSSWDQPDSVPSHDVGHLAFSPSTPTPQILWSSSYSSSSSEARLLSQPIVTKDHGIFVLSHDGRLFCIDQKTGKRRFDVSINPENKKGEETLGGGCSYHEDTVFVATAYGELIALKAEGGEILWRTPLQSPCRSAPTVYDGKIYVVTLKNQLEVFDAQEGKLLWMHAGIPEGLGILGMAAPAIFDDVIVVAYTSGEICGLRAKTGTLLWSDMIVGPRHLGEAQNVAHIRANPLIHKGVVYVLSYSGQMVAFNLYSGHRLWEIPAGGFQSSVCSGGTLFLITNSQELVALDSQTGQVFWTYPLKDLVPSKDNEAPQWFGPLLAGGALYVLSHEGVLTPFNPETGKPLPQGQLNFKKDFLLSPIVVDGVLYALSESGSLYAVR